MTYWIDGGVRSFKKTHMKEDDQSVSVTIDLGDLSEEMRNAVRSMAYDGVITDDEMLDIIQLKSPHLFTKKLVEVKETSRKLGKMKRELTPMERKKLTFLAIVSPSVLISAIALIIGM